MSDCIHHWRQEAGDVEAPFRCINCGDVKAMETDFYKLFESRKGRPWRPTYAHSPSFPADLRADDLKGSLLGA